MKQFNHLFYWLAMFAAVAPATARPPTTPAMVAGTESAEGLALVAHDFVQSRSIYQLVPHKQGDRWYLYIGHIRGAEPDPATGLPTGNGTSVVDITDPRRPRYLNHIAPSPAPWSIGTAEEATGGQHVQICDGNTLPAGRRGVTYMLRNHGAISHELLDVSDPRTPRFLRDVVRTQRPRDGLLRTHKNLWDCASGIAYTVGSVAGWTGQILQVYDLSNPDRPRHIRDFGLSGTQPGGTTARDDGFSIHEASLQGNRLYLSYGTDRGGVIQIIDRMMLIEGDPAAADRLTPSDASLRYPVIAQIDMPGFWGAHTSMPFKGIPIADYHADAKGAVRDFLFVTSEGINPRCSRVRHATFFLDITDEKHPWPVSNFQVGANSNASGTPDYCSRFASFGPHSPQAIRLSAYDGKMLFLSYFDAGIRVIDMRDPFAPVEIGHYVASPTARTRFVRPPNRLPQYQQSEPPVGAKPWPVMNTVEVDPRGRYIYGGDRSNNGVYVLELTGRVRALAEGR